VTLEGTAPRRARNGWAATSAAPSTRARSSARPRTVVDADEIPAADRDGVCGKVRVEVVVGEFEPGNDEQVVLAPGALRLGFDLGEVVRVISCVHTPQRRVCRQPGIVAAVDVIGDAEHVEGVPPVEVDELRDR
jgi:hypothetical protein